MTIPKPPTGATAAFKSMWLHIWEENALLEDSDYYAVSELCTLIVARNNLDKAMKGEPVKLEINGGTNFMIHPGFKAGMEVRKEITVLLKELGMTPASRAKMGMRADGANQLMDFLLAEQDEQVKLAERMHAARSKLEEDGDEDADS